MQKQRVWQSLRGLLLAAVVAISGSAETVSAVTSSSPNYQVTETQFGPSTTLNSCSAEYCAHATIGDTAVGNASAGETTAEFGTITGTDPLLEVIIDPGESNLGTLTTETTATKTTMIRVRSYLSSGYILQISGTPPTYGGHALATPSTPTNSLAGTEQFAINVVANNSPNVGADPAQIPSNQTSFGEVMPNYRQTNKFMYSSEDTIARSSTASGRTDYTVSMIVNISNSTPAGHYTGDFSAIVIPVY